MITKTQKAITLYNEHELRKSLAIVQKFRRLPNGYSKILKQGHECIQNPRYYAQTHNDIWVKDRVLEAYNILGIWVRSQNKPKNDFDQLVFIG